MCQSLPGASCLKGMKGPCVSRHYKNPGEVVGEDAIPVMVETAGLKRSQREFKDWHHLAGLETLKKAQDTLFLKIQAGVGETQHVGDVSTMRSPQKTSATME